MPRRQPYTASSADQDGKRADLEAKKKAGIQRARAIKAARLINRALLKRWTRCPAWCSAASSAAQDKKRGADPEAEDEAKEEKKAKMADQKV